MCIRLIQLGLVYKIQESLHRNWLSRNIEIGKVYITDLLEQFFSPTKHFFTFENKQYLI